MFTAVRALRVIPLAAPLSVLGACSSDPQPKNGTGDVDVAQPTQSASPSASSTSTAASTAKTLVYEAAGLEKHQYDLHQYPPTACRLGAMLGDQMSRLKERGGAYPTDHDESNGGYAYYAATCPQIYCDTSLVWVHPDGGMVVAIQEGDTVDLFANRPDLAKNLPDSVEKYLTEVAGEGRNATRRRFRLSPDKPLADPQECSSPAVKERTARYEAARANLACDPEFTSFYTGAAVSPKSGDRAYFHDQASADTKRNAFVVGGDLVRLAQQHPTQSAFVCAEYIHIDGVRTVGWMGTQDLTELAHEESPPTLKAAESIVAPAGKTPQWLAANAQTRKLGDLSIKRLTGDRVNVELESVQSGHLCELKGELKLTKPRILEEGNVGCGTLAIVFNNGIFLWENGDCSGARATCTGAYLPAPK